MSVIAKGRETEGLCLSEAGLDVSPVQIEEPGTTMMMVQARWKRALSLRAACGRSAKASRPQIQCNGLAPALACPNTLILASFGHQRKMRQREH